MIAQKTHSFFLLFSLLVSLSACKPTLPEVVPSLEATSTETFPSDLTEVPVEENPVRLIGYFTSWGVGMRGYQISMIPADRLTHINYAFAAISPSEPKCALGDPVADIQKFYGARDSVDHQADVKDSLHGNFNQLLKFKQLYPQIQVLISIGGWNGSNRFSDMALTETSRRQFVASCIELFMVRYPGVFDGIDIDWEYPVSGGLRDGRPEDKRNFTLLLQEFRRQLDAQSRLDGKPYLLTIAAPAGPAVYPNLELDQIHRTLNWINLMTYDFHGAWDAITNFNAPLHASSGNPSPDPAVRELFNVEAAVKAYLAAGIPPQKLVVGVPFYARGWQGVPDVNHGLYQPAGGASPGVFEPGVYDYSAIKRDYLPSFQRFWHAEAGVPWLYDPTSGIFITYEDPESVTLKASYVIENQLGGIMFWELSNDGGELVSAIYETLNEP